MFRAPSRSAATRALLSLTLAGLAPAGLAHAATVDTTTVTGTLVKVADTATPDARVRVAGGAFVPVKPEQVQNVASGSTVRVTAQRRVIERSGSLGATTTTAAAGDVSVVATPTVSAAMTPSTQRLTVAIVTPNGVTGTPATEAQVRSQVASASQYWSSQTGGTVSFAVASVSAPMNLQAGCNDYWGMWQEAAQRVGFQEAADSHLVLELPTTATNSGCSYGLGSIGGNPHAGGYLYVSDTAWPVLAHELGHNLGLAHAERLLCGTASDTNLGTLASSGCQIQEYGDPWDVMAASPRNSAGSLSTPQAYRTGLIPASAVTQVTSGTATATLNAVASENGTRAVRVVDPYTGVAYFVEYRTRAGQDYLLYQDMTAGVRILRDDTTSSNAAKPSLALDTSPSGKLGDYTWGMSTGGSFTSYGGGVTVQVTGMTATTATVSVTAGKPAPRTATPTATPTTTTTAAPKTTTTTVAPKTTTTAPVAPKTTTSTAPQTFDLTARTGQVSALGLAGWYDVPAVGYLFNSALVTYTYGASWSTTVQGGTTMSVLGTAFPNGAPGRVLIDGVKVADFTSNRAGLTNNYGQLLTRFAVPAGQHKVRIVALPNYALGQTTLALDAYRLG